MEKKYILSIKLSDGTTGTFRSRYSRELEETIESHRSHWVPDSKGGETQT
nr:MAG TPA: hypothetical protein [Caudoviricetes sp.]